MINFRCFQTETEFAEDNFEFDKNSRKFFQGVETRNTVRKGDFARNDQFIFFPQCFQNPIAQSVE